MENKGNSIGSTIGDKGSSIGDKVVVFVSTVTTGVGTGASADWFTQYFQKPPKLMNPKTQRGIVCTSILAGAFLGYKIGSALVKK